MVNSLSSKYVYCEFTVKTLSSDFPVISLFPSNSLWVHHVSTEFTIVLHFLLSLSEFAMNFFLNLLWINYFLRNNFEFILYIAFLLKTSWKTDLTSIWPWHLFDLNWPLHTAMYFRWLQIWFSYRIRVQKVGKSHFTLIWPIFDPNDPDTTWFAFNDLEFDFLVVFGFEIYA